MNNSAVATAIPLRSEINPADTWDLTPLFSTESAYQTAFAGLKQKYPGYAAYRGTLHESAERLLAALEFDKEIEIATERLAHYASLRKSEDGSDPQNLARSAALTNLLTLIREASAFLSPEIQALPDALFESFLADPGLREWHDALRRLRRFRPHVLSTQEEKLLAGSSAVIRAHSETFSQLSNVDMRFGSVVDQDGREMPLSQSTFISFLQNPDREVRAKAFHQFYAEFGDHQFTLANCLAASIRGDVFFARNRNYPSALEAALFPDDVPVTVYDNLIRAVRQQLPALHDYYQLRREVLQLDKLHAYDSYVPLVPDFRREVSFEEATELVTEALAPLGSHYVETLRNGIEKRWIDRYETKGKRSGAFSSSSYGNPPYILLNYRSEVFSSVFTLAHELGHSLHSWFSQSNQLFQDYSYPIFLAEVASTFNEALLTHHLLKEATDPRLRAYLLDRQIEEIRGTLFRQTMFAEFEKRTHELQEAEEALTLEVFQDVYQELLEAYFGPDVALDAELKLECLRIPHFYNAFYVYKYATGISAATALARRVLDGGQAEVNAYLDFLKSGGARYPIETLRSAGVDMSDSGPIDETIALFRARLNELRSLDL
ncbi:MAG: oligoendopeptidase F [Verrucomicrobia bacterium]|nr:oligoendopeptidase F [Verrucomicrobiota bacterium]